LRQAAAVLEYAKSNIELWRRLQIPNVHLVRASMEGDFVANVLQSLSDGDKRQRQKELGRSIMRTHFRCESMQHFTESLSAVVHRTYPDWFVVDVFDGVARPERKTS
jgi:hypothetical protein